MNTSAGFFLPETRFLSLEEVAVKFGDEVITRGDEKVGRTVLSSELPRQEKKSATAEHLETTS